MPLACGCWTSIRALGNGPFSLAEPAVGPWLLVGVGEDEAHTATAHAPILALKTLVPTLVRL